MHEKAVAAVQALLVACSARGALHLALVLFAIFCCSDQGPELAFIAMQLFVLPPASYLPTNKLIHLQSLRGTELVLSRTKASAWIQEGECG